MKSKILISAFLFASVLSSQANATAEMAKAKNCMTCHAAESKLIGPSFKDIKAKYEKDPTAVEKLTSKVKKGSTGVWGKVPMPSNQQVTEAEAQTLVKWILAKQ